MRRGIWVLLTATVIGAGCVGSDGDEHGLGIEEARHRCQEVKKSIWRGRCLAAVEDLILEKARLGFAHWQWEHVLEEAPTVRGEFVVSLADPAPVVAVLQGLQAQDEFDLRTLYLWMAAPGISMPNTGEHSAESIGWPGVSPDEVAAELQREGLRFLTQSRQGVLRTFGGRDGRLRPSAQEQIEEIEATLSHVRRGGIEMYGFRCLCSPRALQRLTRDAGLGLRAVEPVSLLTDHPMWPEDRLRELIIESGGRYGRSGL